MTVRDDVFNAMVAKGWVAEDDAIIVKSPFNPEWDQFLWTTETYIGHYQIQMVIDDSDVTICDIEAEGDSPMIWLEVAEPSEWVVDEE